MLNWIECILIFVKEAMEIDKIKRWVKTNWLLIFVVLSFTTLCCLFTYYLATRDRTPSTDSEKAVAETAKNDTKIDCGSMININLNCGEGKKDQTPMGDIYATEIDQTK